MVLNDGLQICETIAVVAEAPSASKIADEDRLAELTRRFQRGESYAFDALLDYITPRILPLISRFVHNQEDARDAFQEVAIQLYRAMPRFRGDCRFSTYLYRIVVNVCLNFKTSSARRPVTFTDLSSTDGDTAFDATLTASAQDRPERKLLSRERQHALHEAILSLTPTFRAVLVLADVCGMKYAEIAEITQTPIDTVRTRLHRARCAMQEKILSRRELFADND